MFFVIIYSAIDQGYIGLSLASCHKDEIWDLRAELGLIWDHFRALVPIGTKSQIWDIITSTVLVIWIFSFPRPNFPKPRPRLFSETKFVRNRNRKFQVQIIGILEEIESFIDQKCTPFKFTKRIGQPPPLIRKKFQRKHFFSGERSLH